MVLAAVKTSRAIRRLASRFDVLHAHNAQVRETAWAVRSARASGLPTLVKVVNTGEWFDLAMLARLSGRGRPWLRWLVEATDRWVAISLAVVANLREFGIPADRIVHLSNGVRLPDAVATIPPVARHFLHLGRLASTAPRDIDGLIRTFELIAQRHPEAELSLVGGGNRLAQVQAAAARSPVGSRLTVHEHQSPSPWLEWAHCMVHPSFFEGMSNALLEGMAAGLACVAYDIPPNREALGDGAAGILVPVGDHRELAAALSDLASVDGLARTWGGRARKRAEDTYDIEKIATRTIALYEELLNRYTGAAPRQRYMA
jgi:glycosyltransferase involved in cell wall biosynthesis